MDEIEMTKVMRKEILMKLVFMDEWILKHGGKDNNIVVELSI